jgi:hypothetical protein
MMPEFPMPPDWVTRTLREGIVIPAHPLALTSTGKLNARRQQALTRYYHAAGAGGIAVGVHTTQFAIRDPKHGLLRPVLELAAQTVAACDSASLSPKGERPAPRDCSRAWPNSPDRSDRRHLRRHTASRR